METKAPATDILVETENPVSLDRTVQHFGAAVIQDGSGGYLRRDGGYVVRCFGDPGYLEFAITNQRYGKVLGRLPAIL